MVGSRSSSGIACLVALVALGLAMFSASPAEARNVPGSASAIQSRIDRAVAFSLVDTTLTTARDAALFNLCQDFARNVDEQGRDLQRSPCEWGISLGGGIRYVEGSPNGFDFDFTSTFGSLVVAHAISPSTTVVAALIAETGDGKLHFNDGTLKNSGVGGLVGAIVKLNDGLDLSVIGGAEWLNYKTTRSGGTYKGEYDALRYMVDAQLHGVHDAGTYFVDYSGGLRFIHQKSDSYQEYSGGVPFADVPESDFTALTGLGNVKIGTVMQGFTPYVEATGYVNFIDDTDLSAVLGTAEPGKESVFGRLGVGLEMNVASGMLSLTTGVFAGQGGFQGVDGGFKFVKTF